MTRDVRFQRGLRWNFLSPTRNNRSLKRSRFTGVSISADSPNTLYVVNAQAEKADLIWKGNGRGNNSPILTINEFQGLTYKYVVIIQTNTIKSTIHDTITHTIVAIIKTNTNEYMYYTDAEEDAIGKFIR